jgi:hypothetical protein
MRVSGRTLCLAMLAALALAPAAATAAPEEDSLGRIINRELRAGGPFFTAPERALVERSCGYAPGQWDGFEANISNGVFTCRDGRRVDDPEMRAMLRAAGPRIGRRVRAVMARPAVAAAISRVARAATERALRRVGARHGR